MIDDETFRVLVYTIALGYFGNYRVPITFRAPFREYQKTGDSRFIVRYNRSVYQSGGKLNVER